MPNTKKSLKNTLNSLQQDKEVAENLCFLFWLWDASRLETSSFTFLYKFDKIWLCYKK